MDIAKWYFTKLGVVEINKCKIVKACKVCKQTQLVQLTHLDEECEAQMIQPIRSIPASCSQRIVELNHTLWTQLDNNEWLYGAPKSDALTVLQFEAQTNRREANGNREITVKFYV